MIDEIVIKFVETQGIPTALVLLLFYQIRDMQKSIDSKMCKMLDAIIDEMRNDAHDKPTESANLS